MNDRQAEELDMSCHHCGHTWFYQQRVDLKNRDLLSFLASEKFNGLAAVCICARCGYIHWFSYLAEGTAAEPEAKVGWSHGDTGRGGSTRCLSCGTVLEPEETSCPKCGWTYDVETEGT